MRIRGRDAGSAAGLSGWGAGREAAAVSASDRAGREHQRAAHARAVATAKGRRIGRSVVVDPDELAWAAHLRDTGSTIAEIVERTGIARTSLYRHLPPRPEHASTASGSPPTDR